MARFPAGGDEMIQLYDTYQQYSRDLHDSLSKASMTGPTVVINDDGFLPQDITSPYSYYCGMETGQGKPLHFNQVPVPNYWEIAGNNQEAAVWEYTEKRAKIFYAEPRHKRLVKNVDWLDPSGKVTSTDHYNQYGWLFARTHFDQEQTITIRNYYNKDGKVVIVENFKTGDISLTIDFKTRYFENRIAFFQFFFKEMQWDSQEIWYNSLSTPFFLSYNHQEPGQDILFWKEPVGDELPGNMRVMLNNPYVRTQKVVVQDRSTYDRMKAIASPEQAQKLHYLGLIYPEKRSNQGRKSILILTNSDQIEQLNELVQELPDFHFHVAALTEMSQRLMAFDQFENVTLYPNVTNHILNWLFDTCDLYFDINYGNEVLGAVRNAFENNQLILGFEETLHDRNFIAREYIFKKNEIIQMLEAVRSYQLEWNEMVKIQRHSANFATVEDYQNLLKG